MLKITEISKDKTVLQLSIQELEVFIAALEEVVFSIYLQEFHARIGVYREEVQDLKELMKKALLIHRMKKDTLNSKNSFELSFDQFITLSQCISEVCHGFDVPDFEKKIGITKERLEVYLEDIFNSIDQIEASE
jgi:uncharacterized small protein (DUF1192 family)